MRIIIVDDDKLVTESLKTILESDRILMSPEHATAAGMLWNYISI